MTKLVLDQDIYIDSVEWVSQVRDAEGRLRMKHFPTRRMAQEASCNGWSMPSYRVPMGAALTANFWSMAQISEVLRRVADGEEPDLVVGEVHRDTAFSPHPWVGEPGGAETLNAEEQVLPTLWHPSLLWQEDKAAAA